MSKILTFVFLLSSFFWIHRADAKNYSKKTEIQWLLWNEGVFINYEPYDKKEEKKQKESGFVYTEELFYALDFFGDSL